MHLLGFDIGGTTCGVCLGNSDGEILTQYLIPTHNSNLSSHQPEQVFRTLIDLIDDDLQHLEQPIESIGVSCGAPVDARTGKAHFTDQLANWRGFDPAAFLKTHYQVPVQLHNDANAGALAELFFGQGAQYNHFAFLTFGTGLGAGLVLNHQLYCGANGLAGELAHMRLSPKGPQAAGKQGSFEGFCSGHGIAKLADLLRQQWNSPCKVKTGMTCKQIAALARAGEPCAREVFHISGKRLGEGLALVNDMLNLEAIFIGSVFARCEDLLRPAMEESLQREGLENALDVLNIQASSFGEDIGFYAALAVACESLPVSTCTR